MLYIRFQIPQEFMGCLKKLNGVAKNRLVLEELDIIETDKTIEVYNKNCIDLLEKIEENDIFYIDPI